MTNYADEFLKEKPTSDAGGGKPVNWSDMLLNESGPKDSYIGDKPLGSVLTKEFMGKKGIPASWFTHWQSGHVDDPQTKMSIYAAGRFPELPKEDREKRYGFHKGEVVYMGDDGKLYQETPDTWMQKLKQYSAEEAANAPSIILGSVLAGMTGGWSTVLAMAGAASGEAARKTIGKYAYDEPQSTVGNVQDIATAGLMAGAGEKISRGILRIANWVGAKRGGRVVAAAGKRRRDIDVGDTRKVRQAGDDFGIQLPAPAASGSRSLVNQYNLLGDLEPTADIIQKDRLKLMSQIEAAMPKMLKTISQPAKTLTKTTDSLVKAARKAVMLPVKVRKSKAGPIYKKAFDENPDVNIDEVVGYIDKELQTAKYKIRTKLIEAKNALMKPDLEDGAEVLDTSLKGLHGTKVALGDQIDSARETGLGNTVKYHYKKISKLLLKQMDKASPDYKRARQVFSDLSKEVDKQSIKTLMGDIAKLEGDKKIKAVTKLFSSTDSHPEVIAKTARQIHKQDPEVLGQSLRHWFSEEFKKIRDLATDDITNFGGMFQKKMFGTQTQKDKIKAITDIVNPTAYDNIEKLMTVFKRVGPLMRKESTTAARQDMLKEGVIGRVIKAKTMPLYTYKRIIGDFLRSQDSDRNLKKLANALVSDDAVLQLEKMIQLPASSERLGPMLGTFLTMVAGDRLGKETAKAMKKDALPPAMLPSLESRLQQKEAR